MLPKPGDVVAQKYRVIRTIGEGGMGTVFEAEHTITGRHVALKWLRADVTNHGGAAQRLVREAQISARVRHPSLVDVFDVGQEGDAVFLVMELLVGEPLTRVLEHGGLSIAQLVALLLPAMRGVAAAHRAGVIHRDIKPDNIFLARVEGDTTPVAKVLDFGISKVLSRTVEDLTLTRTGTAMGTPAYMSYEQLSGEKDIDARTDVYAFGVILYRALTGRLPYEASTLSELAMKVALSAPKSPKELRADIPKSLDRLVQWAMERDRTQRLPTMDAFIDELSAFETEHGFRAQMTLDDAAVPEVMPLKPASAAPLPPVPPRSGDGVGEYSATAIASTLRASEKAPRHRARIRLVLPTLALVASSAAAWALWHRAPDASERAPTPARASRAPALDPALASPLALEAPRSPHALPPDAGVPAKPDPTTSAAGLTQKAARAAATKSTVKASQSSLRAKARGPEPRPQFTNGTPVQEKPASPMPEAPAQDAYRVGEPPHFDEF